MDNCIFSLKLSPLCQLGHSYQFTVVVCGLIHDFFIASLITETPYKFAKLDNPMLIVIIDLLCSCAVVHFWNIHIPTPKKVLIFVIYIRSNLCLKAMSGIFTIFLRFKKRHQGYKICHNICAFLTVLITVMHTTVDSIMFVYSKSNHAWMFV